MLRCANPAIREKVDEFGAKLVYVKGVNNIVADALSRLDTGAEIPMKVVRNKRLPEVFLSRQVYANLS